MWDTSGVFSTVDQLNATYPTDDALAAYIQAGMGGTVPRPEITGNDLRDLTYRIRRTSVAGGYTSTVTPGPDQTDFNAPIISNVVTTRFSATSIQVRWTTNKPSYGFVAALRIIPLGHQLLITVGNSRFGRALLRHPTRSRTISLSLGLPTTTPTHFTIVAKDMAGNSSNTPDDGLMTDR